MSTDIVDCHTELILAFNAFIAKDAAKCPTRQRTVPYNK